MTRLLRFDSIVDGSKDYSGWLQFLDWGNGLLGIAEIHQAGEKSSLFSVSFGPSANAQHAVLTRFFRSKVRYKHLLCIAVTSLHFRALRYVNQATGKVVILPLYSAIAPLAPGRRYSPKTAQARLQAALDHRLKSARENLKRATIPREHPPH
jgi:hypothetical protein